MNKLFAILIRACRRYKQTTPHAGSLSIIKAPNKAEHSLRDYTPNDAKITKPVRRVKANPLHYEFIIGDF